MSGRGAGRLSWWGIAVVVLAGAAGACGVGWWAPAWPGTCATRETREVPAAGTRDAATTRTRLREGTSEAVGRFDPRQSPFGVQLSVWDVSVMQRSDRIPTLMKDARDLGVGWVRFDVIWQNVEPSRGTYDWSLADKVLEAGGSQMNYLFTVYTSSRWGTRSGTTKMFRDLPSPNVPSNPDDYRKFLEELVRRYKSRVKYWQIDNEVYGGGNFWAGTPNGYVKLLRGAAQVIRRVDPKAKILSAGIALGAFDVNDPSDMESPKAKEALSFLDLVIKEGKDSFDVADVHLYWKWQAIGERLAFVKRRMERSGARKPIWVTELGGPDLRAFLTRQEFDAITPELGPRGKGRASGKLEILRGNEEARVTYFEEYARERFQLQARELVKRFMLALAEGAERVFWHKLEPEGEDLFWNRMALTDREGIRGQGFFAYRLLTETLAGLKSVTRLDSGPGVYLYDVETTSGGVHVGWAERPTLVELPHPDGLLKATDALGETYEKRVTGGKLALDLTPTPVFLVQ